jgi:quercetin dioxygenase-like cupin family protein
MKGYKLQTNPTRIPANKEKIIEEYFGLSSDGDPEISIAQMTAPPGWSESYQTPNFDEFTLVISGKKQVIVNNEKITLHSGQSIKVFKNSRVQYSNPYDEPCKYVSICTPAFSIKNVNREL